jgi:hypothetical protein
METLWSILKETSSSMIDTLSAAGPKILAAGLVVIVGLLVARTAKAIVHHLLGAVRFERFAERIGLSNVLGRAEVQQSSSEIVCTLVYWTFLVFTALVALTTLGFASAGTFEAVGAMIPKVVIAVAILMLGINVSAFLSKMIQTAAVNAEVRQARFVRNAAYYGMSTLVAILALQQLGISNEILGTAFTIFFGGTCLALALAFGLGSRELAGAVASATWKTEQEQARTLSEASELGNDILPSQRIRARNGRVSRSKTAAA